MSIPHQSSAIILLREFKDGQYKVLLLQRNSNHSYGSSFAYPGGRVDPEDHIIEQQYLDLIQEYHSQYYDAKHTNWYPASIIAVLRELKEETGISLDSQDAIKKMKPFMRLVTPPEFPAKRHDTQFFFIILSNESNSSNGINAQINNHQNLDNITINLEEHKQYQWGSPFQFLEQFLQDKIIITQPIYYQLLMLNQLKTTKYIMSHFEQQQINNPPYSLTFPIIFQFRNGNLETMYLQGDQDYDINRILVVENQSILANELSNRINLNQHEISRHCYFRMTEDRDNLNNRLSIYSNVSMKYRYLPYGILGTGWIVKSGIITEQFPKL